VAALPSGQAKALGTVQESRTPGPGTFCLSASAVAESFDAFGHRVPAVCTWDLRQTTVMCKAALAAEVNLAVACVTTR
jgi:hypothetical protein